MVRPPAKPVDLVVDDELCLRPVAIHWIDAVQANAEVGYWPCRLDPPLQ